MAGDLDSGVMEHHRAKDYRFAHDSVLLFVHIFSQVVTSLDWNRICIKKHTWVHAMKK